MRGIQVSTGQSVSLQGVLFSADSVSGDGERQDYGEFFITLEDGTIDVRLGDCKDTIWMLDLLKVEEALRQLKRWERARERKRAEA
jgi:hypothetical protein